MRAAVATATEDAWAAAASDKKRAVRTVADESQHRQATVVHDAVAAVTAQLRGDFAATSEARAAEHAATIGCLREAHDIAAREAASMQRCEAAHQEHVADIMARGQEAMMACESQNDSAAARHRHLELDVADLQATNDRLVDEANLRAREAHDAACVAEAHTAAVAVMEQTLETQIMELRQRNTDLVELARVHATVETTADDHQVHAEALELRIAELECINASLLELGEPHVAQAADATQVEALMRQRIAKMKTDQAIMVRTASDQAMVHTAVASAFSSSLSSSSLSASLSKPDIDNNLRKSPIAMPSHAAGSDDDTDMDRLRSADVADVHAEDVDQIHLGRRLFCETQIEEVIAEGCISLEAATNSEENATVVGGKGERLKECVSCKESKKKVEFAANQWKKAKARPPTCKACTETTAARTGVLAKAENTDDLDDTDFLLDALAKLSPSKRSANVNDFV
jgi:hypothetical protein